MIKIKQKKSYVWRDPLNNNNQGEWELIDTDNLTYFARGKWNKEGDPEGSSPNLRSLGSWLLTGEFELIVDYEVTGKFGGIDPQGDDNVQIAIVEDAPRFKSDLKIGISGDLTGNLQFFLSESGQADINFGSPSFGTHRVRMIRNADTSVTGWVWYNNRWEWDGDPSGYTTAADFNLDVQVSMSFGPGQTDPGGDPVWLDGAYDTVTLVSGTRVPD